MNTNEVKDLQMMSHDDQFETEMMLMFNKIKACVVELTNPKNHTYIFEITYHASRKYNSDDASTIKSKISAKVPEYLLPTLLPMD